MEFSSLFTRRAYCRMILACAVVGIKIVFVKRAWLHCLYLLFVLSLDPWTVSNENSYYLPLYCFVIYENVAAKIWKCLITRRWKTVFGA